MAMFHSYVSLPEGNVIDIINDISAYCGCYYLWSLMINDHSVFPHLVNDINDSQGI